MDEETKQLVRRRAQHRCEYCGIEQQFFPDFTFHIEHIIARQHRGSDALENLALACHLCNNKKGPNLSGIDPDTNELTQLFNPRKDKWEEHFKVDERGLILGLTAMGRTTVYLLDMNSELRVEIRRQIKRLEA